MLKPTRMKLYQHNCDNILPISQDWGHIFNHKNDIVARIIHYANAHKNETLYQHTCDKIIPLSQDWGNNIYHKNDLVARLLELVKSHKNGDKTIYHKNDTRMATILVSLPICSSQAELEGLN